MSNHFHFVIKVKEPDADYWACVKAENTVASNAYLSGEIDCNAFLEDQFKRFFSSYANKYNNKYERHGSLFQKRFKRIELPTLLSILNKICYVHHNPIHHQVETDYEAWEYSSYKAYVLDKPTKICKREGLILFSDKMSIAFFKTYHQEYHENWLKDQWIDDLD